MFTGCCPNSFAIKFWEAVKGIKKDSPDGFCELRENSNIFSRAILATACVGFTPLFLPLFLLELNR
jgi:hypothetical protein